MGGGGLRVREGRGGGGWGGRTDPMQHGQHMAIGSCHGDSDDTCRTHVCTSLERHESSLGEFFN